MPAKALAFIIGLTIALLAGCASKPAPREAEWKLGVAPPKTIVVMPVRNNTDSIEGVEFVEKVVPETLRAKGYDVASSAEAKRALDAAGISTTDAAWATPVSTLGKVVSADGLMFVSVEKWQKSYELSHSDGRVILSYILYNKAGKKLWQWKQEVFTVPGSYSTPGTGDIVADVVLQMVAGLFSHSLTNLEKLATQANDLAMNSGKNPLPNYR